MRNSSRYITKRNEYDMMVGMKKWAKEILDVDICSIVLICGKYPSTKDCDESSESTNCDQCIQRWLNQKEDYYGII